MTLVRWILPLSFVARGLHQPVEHISWPELPAAARWPTAAEASAIHATADHCWLTFELFINENYEVLVMAAGANKPLIGGLHPPHLSSPAATPCA